MINERYQLRLHCVPNMHKWNWNLIESHLVICGGPIRDLWIKFDTRCCRLESNVRMQIGIFELVYVRFKWSLLAIVIYLRQLLYSVMLIAPR